jgi:hypothetical protein
MLYNGCQYRGCTVQLINVTPLPMAASSASGPHSGTGGTIGLPRQVACVGSWRTRLAGPRYRGRVYWPFAPVDADAGDGTPSTGYIADAAALMSALVAFSLAGTAPNTTAVTMVVRSRLPLPGGTTTPINNFVGLSKWGTIKKRGSFGRANSSPI